MCLLQQWCTTFLLLQAALRLLFWITAARELKIFLYFALLPFCFHTIRTGFKQVLTWKLFLFTSGIVKRLPAPFLRFALKWVWSQQHSHPKIFFEVEIWGVPKCLILGLILVLSSIQCICFRKTSNFRTWGRQNCFLPRAPSNLVTPLHASSNIK